MKTMGKEEIGLSNNFVFQEVMSDERVAILFLEALLGKKISKIKYIGTERNEKTDILAHGIRLDVYIEDGLDTVYNIEMQQLKDYLERRSRYYQSGIDRITLTAGANYDELRESFVIFVCSFDYYGKGDAKYERTSYINHDQSIPFDDGSHVIFLNAMYKDASQIDPAIAEFLDLVRANNVETLFKSDLAKAAANVVKRVRADKGKVVRYMTLEMEMLNRENFGRRRGRAEGRAEGRADFAKLTTKLIALGRIDDLAQAAKDEAKMEELFAEFGLTHS